jgi:hypothetical protein
MMKRSQLGTLTKNEKKRYHATDSSLNFCRKTEKMRYRSGTKKSVMIGLQDYN